ncbi:ABC transporter substrate-binding protein [Scytonema hofmannii PCC 7110]|uniref:Phosphate-binding protein n=1 Tax=Scytonema hofmannii PCC 7110 TaxID=128403 RepID=A0A139WQW3_9CYAN|nr:PstS family phosphate ABC transporter substrate-binding protein [Scytonema hofmannii]KYC34820.1 ABC transporter substrate-binding protein [Scytonema hofmannii PCC 7110]
MAFNRQVKLGLSLISVTATVVSLTACAGENQASTSKEIKIDGSSTVYPISDAVAKEFGKTPEGQKVSIDVQFSGTTGGFRKFCAGETDISNASRPILIQEMDACVKAGVAFIELPVAFDALTVAVNPQNSWAKDVTVAELKKVWNKAAQGKVTNWNQIRGTYPNRPLKLYGAGKDSGTYDYFNEAIVGNKSNSRSDYTGSEDDNVLVDGISKDPNALGYIPFAYFESNQNKLKALAIDNGKVSISPSSEVVKNAQYQPLSRPLFIYINSKSTQDQPELRAFVEFYLKNAQKLATTVGYIPLPDEGYKLTKIQYDKGEIGTAFKGVPEPNVTIAELLRRQTKFQTEQEAKRASNSNQ